MDALLVEAQVEIPEVELEEMLSLYKRGRYLQAHARCQTHAPLERWEGTPARLFAARLASVLNAPRLAHRIFAKAWRADRRNQHCIYYHALFILGRQGPLIATRFLNRWALPAETSPDNAAGLLSLQARIASIFRDFSRAETLHAEALERDPTNAWTWVERAGNLQNSDRYEEALVAAKHALELSPWYSPAVQSAAHLMVLLGRDQEALVFFAPGLGND